MTAIDRILNDLGTTRRGLVALFGLGVADGSFFPIPVEPFVLPVMAAHPRRIWIMTLCLLAGCIAGTLLFYLVGALAEETLVGPLLAMLGLTDEFALRAQDIRDNSFLTLFLIGLSPIPLQIGTLGAGVVGVDPLTFLLAMLLSRGLRFGLMAVAAMILGISAADYFARYRGRLVLGSIALAGVSLAVGKTMGY
jgi:membrane protein YqaA with SNARE-associated domain